MALFYLWLASAFSALAGTVYWLRLPHLAPNKDHELLGLTLLWLWLACLSAIYYAIYWFVKQLWEGGSSWSTASHFLSMAFCVPISVPISVPQGRPRIAQCFSTGQAAASVPVPGGRQKRELLSDVPVGTCASGCGSTQHSSAGLFSCVPMGQRTSAGPFKVRCRARRFGSLQDNCLTP